MIRKASVRLTLGTLLTQICVASGSSPPSLQMRALNVHLPVSTAVFPAGQGASIANSQCLICHSAEMVLFQPRRTQAQWTESINKMRAVYGAPIPAEQVDALAVYLASVISREPGKE